MSKIGILKEGKIPIDRRVAITPSQAQLIKARFPNVELVCQKSDIRCFSDNDYAQAGIALVDNVADCDIIFGVKEVPLGQLIPNKTYFFFSHTIKKQEYNRDLLNEALDKNIRLIDYETLTNAQHQRIIAFGRYAGIVGAYNALWAFGKRYNLFHIRRAHECFDLDDMKTEYSKIKLPIIKIAITGGGRVAKGAMEVLLSMNMRKVTPERFVNEDFQEPVFTQLNSRDYNRHKDGKDFKRSDFFEHPENFESDFYQYAKSTDLLIACAYWKPEAPVLFTRKEATHRDFKINIIADVTCDIEGSIPSTIRPATIEDPVFDYDPTTGREMPAFSDEGNITVMSVDNLPCELPRNASEDFGKELVNNILPCLLGEDPDRIIERATITNKGKLTKEYAYLQKYADGKE
ncbi:NAD(P)-dependent oxidoreductase [Reichenbachiella carrageenanivorans]|uniref:Saccharopine dehydrogenase [NAD(+), L-lysine-forming] n=1 Tax=Reichenbachiella carrageenanivorans TaxID=2979869 RepID=A0ABY6D6N9_9BACT|nr:NAD(P)-dependent oxidoreductase [Reichenbachiella carrageenanivorans]UXX80743.1 NAD(P)-dependent oxidoreductase [Reichenbachiella carrageenanivorans]